MNIKYSLEIARDTLALKGYELISDYYNNLDEKLVFKDKEGYYYEMSFWNFCRNHKPQKFQPNNSYSIQNINLLVKLKNLDLYLITEKYIRYNQKLTFIDIGGYYYQTTVGSLLVNDKPVLFDTRNNYTIYNLKLWLKNNKPDFSLISEEYKGNKHRLVFKDNLGYYYDLYINNLINNYEPEKFAKSNPHTIGNINLWLQITGKDKMIQLLSTKYINSESKLIWMCLDKNCKKEFRMNWSCVQGGHGCSACKETMGEKETRRILINYNINFLPQYTFSDCKNVKVLQFDFYLLDYIIAIEYQGEQHYFPVDFAGKGEKWAEQQFTINQKRDQIKRDYCKNNNIKLIEIPYWDFDNIEKILIRELKLNDIKLAI